jgi:hypothetical protein
MGKYDAVIISEFPNNEASAKFMLATGALGNVNHPNHESLYRRGISQNRRFAVRVKQREGRCILAGAPLFLRRSELYSALASFRMGMSGSASFQRAKNRYCGKPMRFSRSM